MHRSQQHLTDAWGVLSCKGGMAMRVIGLVLLGASALALASAASATTIDGIISPGEYAGATTTTTPYSPGADTTLSTFGSGNENVAETIYYQADPNGLGIDIAIMTDPAGAGNDNADASVGDQFTNLYFGDPNQGAYIGFELGNQDAFVPATGASYNYSTSGLGIQYADTPGTTYANGGKASVSEAYIPFTAYQTLESDLGLPVSAVGDTIQLRDIQAFAYAGNNGSPAGSRFGSVTISAVSAAPEPSVWVLMIAGIGMIGAALRHGRRRGTFATA